LAEQFDVSRTGVREALRVLEIQGLVRVRHGYGGGVFIADVGFSPVLGALQTSLELGQLNVDELYEARVLFEPMVARLAAERAEPALAEALEKNVARAEAAFAENSNAFGQNLEFHVILAQAAGNRVLGLVMQALCELLDRLHHDYPTNRSVSRKAIGDHQALIEAVRAHDGTRAASLMTEHLQRLEALFARIQEHIERTRSAKVKTIRPWRGVRLDSALREG
jgi:GntR family transcriptional repressor for pyruvate dehydrogenase complex